MYSHKVSFLFCFRFPFIPHFPLIFTNVKQAAL